MSCLKYTLTTRWIHKINVDKASLDLTLRRSMDRRIHIFVSIAAKCLASEADGDDYDTSMH